MEATNAQIIGLAEKCLTYLETRKRKEVLEDEQDDKEFVCTSDKAPEWFIDLCMEAHNQFFAEDYKYKYIKEMLYLLSNAHKEMDLEEYGQEYIMADFSNWDLLQWVSSDLKRSAYVEEEIVENNCYGQGFFQLLQAAQCREKQEIYTTILHGLRDHLSKE